MFSAGSNYPLDTIDTVLRAYDIFRAYERKEGRKNKNKEIQILGKKKIQDFKILFFFKSQNSTISLPVKWKECEKSTFLSLCLDKETVGA
jgi:hypothetical protein